MRKVILNTTPMIALSEIGKLYLFKELYGEVYIPEAVYEEVKSEPAYSDVRKNSDWIHVTTVTDDSNRFFFKSRLHAGEVEVMMLALETNADLVVLDDNLARKTAKYMGLTITGTLGVVIKAKKEGLINNAGEVFDKLINSGLFISDEVKEIALHEAGE